MSTKKITRRFFAYLPPYLRGFLIAIVAMVITAIAEASFPALMKPLLDKGFAGQKDLEIWKIPTFIVLIFLVRGISGFVGAYCLSWVSQGVLRDIRTQLFKKLIQSPICIFDKTSTAKFLTVLTQDVSNLTGLASTVLTTLVRDTLILVGLLCWLVYLNWKLTAIVITLIPLFIIVTRFFSKKIKKTTETWLQSTKEIVHMIEQAVSNIRVIKAYGLENLQTTQFKKISNDLRSRLMRATAVDLTQPPITQFLAAIVLSIVLSTALYQSKLGYLSIGEFVSFLTAMLMILSPIKHLSQVNATLQRALVSAENIFSFLDGIEESRNEKKLLPLSFDGSIEFRNISFTYENRDKEALSDISFKVEPGEHIAFVGPSGGGKSTILGLLVRFYEPTNGSIFVGREKISNYPISFLRNKITYVSQEVFLFDDTIKNNLTLDTFSKRDDKELWIALEACLLKEFVQSLPDGLDTQIGARGVQLSGGQRQRLAISRALLRNSPILLLDEATSALDNETELLLKNSIRKLARDRTILSVAHRLGTISDADKIFYIANGSIVASGSHENLLNLSPEYRSMFTLKQDSRSSA